MAHEQQAGFFLKSNSKLQHALTLGELHSPVLSPRLCRRGLGLGLPAGGEAGSRAVVAFSFGPPELWQRFAVYFLTADGAVWTLCPVLPFGAWLGRGGA